MAQFNSDFNEPSSDYPWNPPILLKNSTEFVRYLRETSAKNKGRDSFAEEFVGKNPDKAMIFLKALLDKKQYNHGIPVETALRRPNVVGLFCENGKAADVINLTEGLPYTEQHHRVWKTPDVAGALIEAGYGKKIVDIIEKTPLFPPTPPHKNPYSGRVDILCARGTLDALKRHGYSENVLNWMDEFKSFEERYTILHDDRRASIIGLMTTMTGQKQELFKVWMNEILRAGNRLTPPAKRGFGGAPGL